MPKNMTIIKLGSRCRDKATKLEGALTHLIVDMDGRFDYLFQPEGINPETGQPVDKIILEPSRVEVFTEKAYEDILFPVEILGTEVKNKTSGFKGMAVGFVLHLSGCFHVQIQPAGSLPKTNSPIRKCEFDLRECAGYAIAQLSISELKESMVERPSPMGNTYEEPIYRSHSALNE